MSEELQTKEEKETPPGCFAAPKDAVHLHKCPDCGCAVFVPGIEMITIDVNKASEMGYPIPQEEGSGRFQTITRESGVLQCFGCGKRMKADIMVKSHIINVLKAEAAQEKPSETMMESEGSLASAEEQALETEAVVPETEPTE